jgi:glycosidase
VSKSHDSWKEELIRELPDLKETDITGSPFAIMSYTLNRQFGTLEELVQVKKILNEEFIHLILDLVPNHIGLDHRWIEEHPEYLIVGTEDNLRENPKRWTKIDNKILAYGRDPYYDGWPDTLQINYRHAGLRQAMKQEIQSISQYCDGLRCDMSMLLLPDVIQKTWGNLSIPLDGTCPVDQSFWLEAIPEIRELRPDFIFIAEVYWDLEWELQQQGFNYTYDKRLYDRLRDRIAEPVKFHLNADLSFMNKSVRFLENHDEPRAASVYPDEKQHQAAAIITYGVPGMHFFAEGQFDGFKSKVSMHVGRRRKEPQDPSVYDFYTKLIHIRNTIKDSIFSLRNINPAWDGNSTHGNFIAWTMVDPKVKYLFVVNYGWTQGQCRVMLENVLEDVVESDVEFNDIVVNKVYKRSMEELKKVGIYIDLPTWGYHVFIVG